MIDAMHASTDRPVASRKHRAPPAGNAEGAITASPQSKALVILIIAVNAVAVIPDGVKYLYVQHRPLDLLGYRGLTLEFPMAKAAGFIVAITLVMVCSVIVLRRRHLDRNVFGVTILLLALVVPYIASLGSTRPEDFGRVALAAGVIIAIWSIEAPVDGLKWLPVAGSVIGTYSIIGGLLIPDYMNNITDSTKLIVPEWALAGPFAHGNFLGLYCVFVLALTPLISSVRWKALNGLILCTTIVLSASRTAMFAAAALALWWILCWLRLRISRRVVGTFMIVCSGAIVVLLPLLNSNPETFVGRGYAWAAGLSAWQESPLVGKGAHYEGMQFRTVSDSWAFSHGHNLFVDTLLRSGLLGLFLLFLILFAAVRSTRALEVSSHRTAFFGYLIAFLVASSTEVNWSLLPTWPLFPAAGFVFAVLLCRSRSRPDGFTSSSEGQTEHGSENFTCSEQCAAKQSQPLRSGGRSLRSQGGEGIMLRDRARPRFQTFPITSSRANR